MPIILENENNTRFTYLDVKTDALIALKGTAKAAYKDPEVNKIVNDAVQIARKIAARINPEMVWSTVEIQLEKDNPGPYYISSDFESKIDLFDENGITVDGSYRGEFNVPMRKTKPDGYWIEGYDPVEIYLNATPDKAYLWRFYYIATLVRENDFNKSVPLPAIFRELLVEFVTKFAAQTQEYSTVEEDDKIQVLEQLISGILTNRRSEIRINITGHGFGR